MSTSQSPILGSDGRPMQRRVLSEEIASPTLSGVRSVFQDYISGGLTPERLASVLKRAADGDARDYLTLAEEMEERYLHYASQVQTRRLAIEAVSPVVEAPPGTPSKIVNAVQDLVDSPGFLDMAGSLTDGIAKGYSVVEMMWEYERGALRPVKYIWRDPRFFVFDRLTRSELRLAVDGEVEGVELPKAKFVVHMPRAKNGIPLRRGFARAAAWAYLLQSFAVKDWAAFAEVYGMPLRVGKYHSGASEADKRTLLRAVAAIANDAAAIIPQGMELEFHTVSGAQGEAVFGGLTGYLDKQISKLVVGQTMTADDGSSLGQAKIHNEVRMDILHADCRQQESTVNRDVIPWFVAFNFGPQERYPQVRWPVAEPEDVEALTKAVERMVPLGLKVTQREMREKIGLSEPAEGDELLTPHSAPPAEDPVKAPLKTPSKASKEPPPEPDKGKAGLAARAGLTHPGGCACAGCRAFAALAAEGDGLNVDAEIDQVLAEGMAEWEELADPIFAPLREALKKAGSFAELEAMLPEIAAGMDGTELAEQLARLTAIARGLGDVAD